ncbi:MAG TPA: IclR family transcriptional regulator [Ardenticatenaceae bacterium]|nr:IclR family transcriptional regulator [Ardenticatenaceae bacterium]
MTDGLDVVTTDVAKRYAAVPAVDRALALLRVLATTDTPPTLSELSHQIGVSRSTVYSILATLQDYGFVEKDARHKTYRLGPATLELGSAYIGQVTLLPAFNAIAQRLVNLCGETVKLAILSGRDVVYLGKQEGLYSVRLVARVGSRMPAHATAVGKALLAHLGDESLERLYAGYDFPAPTRHTISNLAALRDALRETRERGYARDREESATGLQCVAAPVFDHSGAAVAAISIGVPNDRLSEARLEELAALVREHAGELSRTLGWTETRDGAAREQRASVG